MLEVHGIHVPCEEQALGLGDKQALQSVELASAMDNIEQCSWDIQVPCEEQPLSAVPCSGPWDLEYGQLAQFGNLNRGFS